MLPTADGKKWLDFLRRQTVMLPGPAELVFGTLAAHPPRSEPLARHVSNFCADVNIHGYKQISVSER